MITASDVNKLRQMTGISMMECKKALDEAQGDLDKAIEILKKSSGLKAAKRADKETHEGTIGFYLHANNKLAALVELDCETDFVARNEEFVALAKDLAMQVAALNPLYAKPEEIPEAELEKQKANFREEVKGKPAEVVDKIVTGKLNKYFQEVCLLDQPFVKDDKVTPRQLITEFSAKVGEKIEVGKICRLAI